MVNGAAFCAFGYDKMQAIRRKWRLSNNKLRVFAFFGPFGALAGMISFMHKTRKISYWCYVLSCCSMHGYLCPEILQILMSMLTQRDASFKEANLAEQETN